MKLLLSLVAPMLVLAPIPAVASGALSPALKRSLPAASALTPVPAPATSDDFDSFRDAVRSVREQQSARQVRIEQRIIIRISPGAGQSDPRRNLFADLPGQGMPPHLEERRMNQCVAVAGIAGVQPDGPSRLTLFMRDRRIVSAALEKSCNARDFYSGFLVERSNDGMICAGRDKLLSRSGSNCALGKLRQLVVVDDDD